MKKLAMKKILAISLGGSLLYENGSINANYVREISALLLTESKKTAIALSVGGGAPSREYARAVRELASNEFLADRAAIYATRANATIVLSALGEKAFPKVITDLDDAVIALEQDKIPVCGGMMEGITTDTVALLLAERVGAKKLVNLSKIDAIYSSDPRVDPRAKKLSLLTHKQLVELAARFDQRRATTSFVFDLMACKLAARSNIELHFVNGRDLKQVKKALAGANHAGSIVKN